MKTITPFAGVLSAGTMFGTFAAAAPSSVYSAEKIFSYETGTPQDYDFISDETDETGTPITRYYKIGLNPENFATSSNIKWQEVGADKKDDENFVAVPFLNGTKYYRYTYGEKDRKIYTEWQNALSGDVTADFINGRGGGSAIDKMGGIVYNEGELNSLTGDFVGNSTTDSGYTYGGAIYNKGTINRLTGNFIGNYLDSSHTTRNTGGAIQNHGTINNLSGNFLANHTYQGGGAVSNYGYIQSVNGDFIGNYSSDSFGGAIFNDYDSSIGNIIGDFIGNHSKAYGGAINNSGRTAIGNITGDFIGNYASYDVGSANGGAIDNIGTIGNITGDFIGNYTLGSYSVQGGAIYNSSNGTAIIGDITGNFLSNYVQYLSKYSKLTLGGAVYSNANLSFTAKGKQRFFSGNYTNDQTRGKNYNALFVQSVTDLASAPVIAFDTTGGGAWVVNDSIEGGYASSTDVTYAGRYYNLSFTGDGVLNEDGLTDQYISINNDIINAGEVTVEGTTLRFGAYQHEDKTANNWDGHGRFLAALKADGTADLDAEAVTSLSLNNAAFDLYNEYQDTVNLKG